MFIQNDKYEHTVVQIMKDDLSDPNLIIINPQTFLVQSRVNLEQARAVDSLIANVNKDILTLKQTMSDAEAIKILFKSRHFNIL